MLHLELLRKGVDVIYSIRHKRQDPFIRKLMSSVFNTISKIVLRAEMKDLNCGFRSLSSRAANQIRIYNKTTFAGPEIYVRAKMAGLSITEIRVSHFPRRAGNSVFLGWLGIYRASILMLKYIFKLRRELDGETKPVSDVPREFEDASMKASSLTS